MDGRKSENTGGDSSAGGGAGKNESKLSQAHRLNSELERQNRSVAERLDQAEQNIGLLDQQLESDYAGQQKQPGCDLDRPQRHIEASDRVTECQKERGGGIEY